MQLDEFLCRLFEFYPIDNEDKLKFQMAEYRDSLLSESRKINGNVDFERLYNLIKHEYKYKTVPTIPFIIDLMPCCLERKVYNVQNEGKTVMVITKGNKGYIVTDFVVTSCKNKLGDIISQERSRYGADNVEVKMFPQGWFHLGNKAYPPTDDESDPVILYEVA